MARACAAVREALLPPRLTVKQRLLELAHELYECLITSLSAATLLGAKTIGVGYDIGDHVVAALSKRTEPLLQRPLEDAASGALGSLYRDEPFVKEWIDFAINAACKSVGVTAHASVWHVAALAAHYLRHGQTLLVMSTVCLPAFVHKEHVLQQLVAATRPCHCGTLGPTRWKT